MIILARHGQTEWNQIDRLQGWQNSPLTKLGEHQAYSVSLLVCDLVKDKQVSLYSSPLGRAHDTAKIISSALTNEAKVILEPLLREYSYGEWSGLTSNQVKEQRPIEWSSRTQNKWSYKIPGGESYAHVSERAKAWLTSIADEPLVIAVSHQMIGRTIRGAYLGFTTEETLALTQANNEIIVLENGTETKISA